MSDTSEMNEFCSAGLFPSSFLASSPVVVVFSLMLSSMLRISDKAN